MTIEERLSTLAKFYAEKQALYEKYIELLGTTDPDETLWILNKNRCKLRRIGLKGVIAQHKNDGALTAPNTEFVLKAYTNP